MLIGRAVIIECPAPSGTFLAVFEDDEETGYFYALDTTHEGAPVQDAAWIYNVDQGTDRTKPVKVKIGWASDNNKVALFIDDSPCAVFDCMSKQGYCRSGFPPPLAYNAFEVCPLAGRHS